MIHVSEAFGDLKAGFGSTKNPYYRLRGMCAACGGPLTVLRASMDFDRANPPVQASVHVCAPCIQKALFRAAIEIHCIENRNLVATGQPSP